MYKFSLRYGSLSGIAIGLFMLTLYYFRIPTPGNPYALITNLLLSMSSPFFAIWHLKKYLGGEIDFKTALRIGILAGFITAVIFAIFTAIYYYFINPDYADKYLKDIAISIKQSGVTGKEFNKQMAEWKEEFTAFNQTYNIFIKNSFLGCILALINALILCKKD